MPILQPEKSAQEQLAVLEAAAEAVVSRDLANAAPHDDGLPQDIAPDEPVIELADCDSRAVQELLDSELGLLPLTAQSLVRRGITDVESARELLADRELIAAEELPGAIGAAEVIAKHVEAGTRIAVHGDYDVDGVCSTAILVRALVLAGGDVTWHVPSRFGDGYGLSRAAIESFSADGVGLMVAVDCGITAVAEVAYARSLGIDAVICDHHTPGKALPDAPIVHPALGDYPCPELCAAATTFKLAELIVERLGRSREEIADDLELVALATVCDVVPLRGENRTFVKRGITAMRTTLRPGLRELIRVSAVDQLAIDASTFGFRLGPRINAAGRMFSAEPAVELMLTTSQQRAAELANELGNANSRRQEVEQTVLADAEQQAREQRDRFAIVVHGEGWHAGVLGIVAGRIAERFRRPCVALAVDAGTAAGSGRSGGVYDLHAGLSSCSEHLIRFGGHQAAAGLELDVGAIAAFTRAFQDHAAMNLTIDDLRPRIRVDAVADPSQLTLDAAQSLASLGPFGAGNPEPALLVPAVRVEQLRKMGDRGQHLRLTLSARGGQIGAVAFGWERAIGHGEDSPLANSVVKLRRNEFRGTVEAQARLVSHAVMDAALDESDAPADDGILASGALHESHWQRAFVTALDSDLPTVNRSERSDDLSGTQAWTFRDDSALAALLELGDRAGAATLVVNTPADWKDQIQALVAVEPRLAGLKVIDFDRLIDASDTDTLLIAEPPPDRAQMPAPGPNVQLVWNAAALRRAASSCRATWLDRSHVVAAYRAIKDADDDAFAVISAALAASVPSPELAAAAVKVLAELELVKVMRSGADVESISVTTAQRTELDRSQAFRTYSEIKDQSQRWLTQLTDQKATAR